MDLRSPSDSPGDGGHGEGADGCGTGYRPPASTIEEVYDNFADIYELGAAATRLRTFQRDVFKRFPHHGFTLDLGCGTGPVGMLIRQSPLNSASVDSNADPDQASHQPKIYVHGVDISTRMLDLPWCEQYYDSTEHGLIQDALMKPNAEWMKYAGAHHQGAASPSPMVDHITCFCALHYLNPTEFAGALDRMFALARHSVMFDIDDVTPTYIDDLVKMHGEGLRNYNHVAAYREFGTPVGWAKVVEEEAVLYRTPKLLVDVRGILVRFERVK
jgi:SAM-dependent methyltransferase